MGDISVLGRSAFRAYVTDGVPSSGVQQVDKAEVRALMDAVDAGNGVDTLAALKALTSRPPSVLVKGKTATNDGWGGVFAWVAGSSTTADDALVVQCTGGAAGRYKRLYSGAIDAKWFGAKGDGSTDDTAALQAGLTAAAGASHCLVVPRSSGAYIISAALVQPSGVALVGIGLPTVKLKSACSPIPDALLTGDGADGSRASDVSVSGIIFDGNRTNNINHGTPDGSGNQTQGWEGLPLAGISFAYTDGVKIRDCHVNNMWASAIWVTDCTDEEISGNRLTTYRKAGISVRRYTVASTACRITNNYCVGGVDGIQGIFGSTHLLISGNYCEGNKDSAAFPSFAWDGTYPNVWPKGDGQTWTAYGGGGYVSPVNPGDGAGIELTGYYSGGSEIERYASISGNSAYACQTGVRVEQASERVIVEDNICVGNDLYGIYLYSVASVVVNGNYVEANGSHGIAVQRAAAQIDNALIQIINNQISRNDDFAIALVRTDYVIISGNLCYDNRQDSGATGGAIGIFSFSGTYCDHVKISDNQFYQTGGHWLYYDSTSHGNMVVKDNGFYGTPTTKLTNVNTTNSIIAGNFGIVTRNKGGATVAQNSFITITHGLDFTPDVSNIRVHPVADLQADGRLYVSPTPNSTTFGVIMAGGPATLVLAWSIDDQ